MSIELHVELDRIFAARDRNNMGPTIEALLPLCAQHPRAQARTEFPDSVALGAFESLTLHAAGRVNAALSSLLALLADNVHSEESDRYKRAMRGNAEYLASLDSSARSEP